MKAGLHRWPRIWPLHMRAPGWDVPSAQAVSPSLPQLWVNWRLCDGSVTVSVPGSRAEVQALSRQVQGVTEAAGADLWLMLSVTQIALLPAVDCAEPWTGGVRLEG